MFRQHLLVSLLTVATMTTARMPCYSTSVNSGGGRALIDGRSCKAAMHHSRALEARACNKDAFGSLLRSAWLGSWESGSHGPAASKPGSTERRLSFVSREPSWVLISTSEGTDPTEMQSTNRYLAAHGEPTYQWCSQPNHHEVHAPSLVRSYTSKQMRLKISMEIGNQETWNKGSEVVRSPYLSPYSKSRVWK
jgi:hypothetical protein